MEITQTQLKELFDYDTEQGVLINKISRSNRTKPGNIAGTISNHNGTLRRRVGLKNHRHYAYRLIWLYHYGTWPKHEIDHIDGNSLNDRIENLREAVHAENSQNRNKSPNKTTPYLGVSYFKEVRKYDARITARGKQHCLGLFDTPEEAHAAYCAAKQNLHLFNPEVRTA